MKSQHRPKIAIPDDWTPQQASAVLEFIITIADAILQNQRDDIERYAVREANGPFPQDWDHDCLIRDFFFPKIP